MKLIFVINSFDKLNEITYCSKRIKEHLTANCIADKDIVAMVTHATENMKVQKTLKNIFGITKAMYYSGRHAPYVYHDIHHIESGAIILILDESATAEVIKALMHNPGYMGEQQAELATSPAFDVKERGIQLFILREPCICEYAGEL